MCPLFPLAWLRPVAVFSTWTLMLCRVGAFRVAPLSHRLFLTNHRYRSPQPAPRKLIVRAMSSEQDAAAKAAHLADSGAPTLFDKIIAKEIPAEVIYEDDKALAFKDISPQAPVHFLVIPKVRDGLTRLSKSEERHKEILGHLMYVAQDVAKQQGCEDGFRVVVNDGTNACQSVFHLHIHVMGGRKFTWPAG